MLKSRVVVASLGVLVMTAGLALAQPEKGRGEGRGRGQQASAPAQDFPKSMPVPPEMAAKGTVYYCVAGKERQVSLHSVAPREEIEGHTNNVVGYAIAGPKDNPAKLAGGEWQVPVASIDTGNRVRNRHLTEPNWLDAATYPHISFKLTEVKDIGEAKTDEKSGATSYDCTLVGEMTMHGKSQPMTITGAKIAFRKGDETTKKMVDGDLMMLSCKYTVKLSEFGVQNQVIGQKVAEGIEITQTLVHSTVEPKAGGPKGEDKKDDKAAEKKPESSS